MFRISLEGLGWIDYPMSKGVRVGDRLLPPRISVSLPSDADSPSLRMILAVIDGVPQLREVHLEAKGSGRGIRTSDLRAIPVEDWIEQFYALTATRIVKQDDGVTTAVHEVSPRRQRETERAIGRARAASRRTVTDDLLRRVAATYRANVATRPTEAVRQTFGVSYRTAAGYVQRARAGGMLPPTTAGKRKA